MLWLSSVKLKIKMVQFLKTFCVIPLYDLQVAASMDKNSGNESKICMTIKKLPFSAHFYFHFPTKKVVCLRPLIQYGLPKQPDNITYKLIMETLGIHISGFGCEGE
jgi:hypothetical protein